MSWRAYTHEELCAMSGKELDDMWAALRDECSRLHISMFVHEVLGDGAMYTSQERGVMDLQRAVTVIRAQEGTKMAAKSFIDSVL